jgi:hypothetical protein
MKKHSCEAYRYTAEKYNEMRDHFGQVVGLGDVRFLVSWCSLCGKNLRIIEADPLINSAQAVLTSERAWIEISLGPPEEDPRDDENVVLDLFVCSIQIKNHGRTIARVESVQIGADTVDGPLPKETLNFTTNNLHSLLGSGQKETVGGFNADSGFTDGVSIMNGAKRGILRIIVKYRDVVDASILHETSVLYVFQNSLEEEPVKVSSLSVYT